MTGEQEASEDAAQEAFIRAYKNLHTVYGNTFKAWLPRITTNCCIDMLRRLKRRPASSFEPVDEEGEEIEPASWMVDPNPSIEARVETEELMAAVRICLERLQPDYRTAVILGLKLGIFPSFSSCRRNSPGKLREGWTPVGTSLHPPFAGALHGLLSPRRRLSRKVFQLPDGNRSA
jgi:RNA polymerase sigma factor (sigma-70 family)